MARARNIKPSFFDNDALAENEPLARLLFIGMWSISDFKGDFEWRPKRIKAQILPYDDCDINKLAINLDKSGFIRFYSDGDTVYVNVANFTKHQNPHKNEREKGSDIPAYCEEMRQVVDIKGLTINHDKSRLNRNDSASDRADSCFLIPDSLLLKEEARADKPAKGKAKRFVPPTLQEVSEYKFSRQSPVDPERFIDFYESNGWKVGKNKMKDWKAAFRTWDKREKEQGNGQFKTSNEKAAERMRSTRDYDRATKF